jgi:hypothetical protein
MQSERDDEHGDQGDHGHDEGGHGHDHGGDDSGHSHGHEFHIKIDRDPFTVTEERLTGADLRQLASPPVGDDRDLYLVVPGPGDDQLVGDSDRIDIEDGMHFITAPRTINPGGHARPE